MAVKIFVTPPIVTPEYKSYTPCCPVQLLPAFSFCLQLFIMSTPICPHCGIAGHQRRNHRHCLANPSRTATRAQNEAEQERPDIRICPHCGLQGHQRRSHHDCLHNPTNQNRNGQSEPTDEPVRVAPTCPFCGRDGHNRRNHSDCLQVHILLTVLTLTNTNDEI